MHRNFITDVLLRIYCIPSRGGYFWKFMVGVCRPVLQILTLFQTKKCYFPHPFSDLAFRAKLCHHYQIREKTKKFFKCVSNSHISSSFLFTWNSNDKYVYTLPQFPRKPYPIPDQNRQSVYPRRCIPVFRPKRPQNPTCWGGKYL